MIKKPLSLFQDVFLDSLLECMFNVVHDAQRHNTMSSTNTLMKGFTTTMTLTMCTVLKWYGFHVWSKTGP